MREQDVDLRTVRCDCLEKLRKASVRIWSGHDVHALEKLVLEPFCHTAYYSYYHSIPFSLLELELVYPSPYPLLCVVADGTCVGKYDLGLLYVFSQCVSCILEDGKNHLAVVDIHLAAIGLYVNLWTLFVYDWSYAVHFAVFRFSPG